MATEVKTKITAENRTDRAFRDFRRNVSSAQRSLGQFRKFALSVSAVTTAIFGGARLVSSLREFESLKAQLRTVTGSAEAAGEALELIEDIASRTPFQLEEIVEAFIKLKALGLDPSKEALEAYANVAAGTGKSLNQFIEAVADAATGEFERLKDFGITAKTQGDQVALTFRGVSTVVRKSAGEIESYLRSIGEVEFAGATAERVSTLDGALSNLADEFGGLIRVIGDAGLTEALQDTANSVKVFVENVREAITEVKSFQDAFRQLGKFGSDLGLAVRGDDLKELERLETRLKTLREELVRIEKVIDQQRRGGGVVDVSLTVARDIRQKNIARLEKQAAGLRVVLPSDEASAGNSQLPPRENQTLGGGADDKAAKRRATDLANLVRRRQEEADAIGRTEREIAILEATQLGANQAQLNAINLAFDRIEADERLQEELAAEEQALEKTRRAREAANREAEAMDRELDHQAEQIRQLIDPLRTYQLELERIDEVYKAGKLTQDEFASATAAVQQQMTEAAERLKETDNAFGEFAISAARNIQSAFADFLFRPLDQGFKGLFGAFRDTVKRMIAELAAAQFSQFLFGNFGKTGKIGGAAGGLFGALANVFHQGGIVGLPAPSRIAPALAFAGAARYHDGGVVGLRPGERGIIAQDGEEVLSRRDPRHRYNGGGSTTVNLNIQGSVDTRSASQIAAAAGSAVDRARRRDL